MANPFLRDRSSRYSRTEQIDEPQFSGYELGVVWRQLARVNSLLENRHDLVIASHFIYRSKGEELIQFLEKNQINVHNAYLLSELRRNKWTYQLFASAGRVLFAGRVTITAGLIVIRRSFTFFEWGSLIRHYSPLAFVGRRPFFSQVPGAVIKP